MAGLNRSEAFLLSLLLLLLTAIAGQVYAVMFILNKINDLEEGEL